MFSKQFQYAKQTHQNRFMHFNIYKTKRGEYYKCVAHSYKMIRLLYDYNIVFLLVCCYSFSFTSLHFHLLTISLQLSSFFPDTYPIRNTNDTSYRHENESKGEKKVMFHRQLCILVCIAKRSLITWYHIFYISSNDLEIKFCEISIKWKH